MFARSAAVVVDEDERWWECPGRGGGDAWDRPPGSELSHPSTQQDDNNGALKRRQLSVVSLSLTQEEQQTLVPQRRCRRPRGYPALVPHPRAEESTFSLTESAVFLYRYDYMIVVSSQMEASR